MYNLCYNILSLEIYTNSKEEMKVKKLLVITAIIGLLGLSCGSAGNPEQTVNSFYDALVAGDADAAAECVEGGMTDEEKEMMAAMGPFLADMELNTTGHEIDGDYAIVYAEMTFMGETETEEIVLVLVDGDWKLVEGL